MTAPKKQIGKGTKVFIDATEYGRIESATLPETEFAIVEGDELIPVKDDGTAIDAEIPMLGDLIPKDFEFVQYYDPLHATATALDTKMAARAEVAIELRTPHTPPVSFTGKGLIYKLGVAQIVKRNFYKRTVTIRQTTAIAIAQYVAP